MRIVNYLGRCSFMQQSIYLVVILQYMFFIIFRQKQISYFMELSTIHIRNHIWQKVIWNIINTWKSGGCVSCAVCNRPGFFKKSIPYMDIKTFSGKENCCRMPPTHHIHAVQKNIKYIKIKSTSPCYLARKAYPLRALPRHVCRQDLFPRQQCAEWG